jgi:chromosome segregation ATPase
MKREDLAALGITDDATVQKIMDLHGADLTKLQNNISTLTAERDNLKTQLNDANTKLNGYDPEWKSKAEAAEKAAQQKIEALKFDYALNDALRAAKVRDVVAVKAHLNTDALKLDGDNILGLKEQLENIKKESGFLFEDSTPTVKFSGPTPGTKSDAATANEKMNNALREAFGGGVQQ